MGNQLRELAAAGQSVWLDNIRRSMFAIGRTAEARSISGCAGMTSNPTIFEHAIGTGTDYDEQLQGARRQRARPAEPVRSARDPRHPQRVRRVRTGLQEHRRASTATSRSKSRRRSRTTRKATIDAAAAAVESRRPAQRHDQDPGHAGVRSRRFALRSPPASTSTSRCCSRSTSYAAAANAYIEGLEDRVKAGQPIDRIASVASVFVSRIDTAIDKTARRTDRQGREARGPQRQGRHREPEADLPEIRATLPRRPLRGAARPRARTFSARCGPAPRPRTRSTTT